MTNPQKGSMQPPSLRSVLAEPTARYLLCVDIEATCERDSPWAEEMEIIEIGAVVVDLITQSVVAEFQRYIKPFVHPTLTPFCLELTGITQTQVDTGMPAAAAFADLSAFMTPYMKSLSWCSWGNYDKEHFAMDSARIGVSNPLSTDTIAHTNLKAVFSRMTPNKKRVGLKVAVARIDFDWVGRHHSGLDDARNVANIALYLNNGRVGPQNISGEEYSSSRSSNDAGEYAARHSL